MRVKVSFLVTLISLFGALSFASVNDFGGVEKVTLSVKGKDYLVPIGNKDRKQDLYLIKKVLKGDMDAREMILAGNNKKLFYIGNDYPLWLVITKDSEFVK